MRSSSFTVPFCFGLLMVAAAACGGGNTKTDPTDNGGGGSGEGESSNYVDAVCKVDATVATTPTYAEVVAPILMKKAARGAHQRSHDGPRNASF